MNRKETDTASETTENSPRMGGNRWGGARPILSGTRQMGAWQQYNGVRVIGDVHGHSEAFRALLHAAKGLGLFVVQLGDLVDHGPNSVETLRLALEMCEHKAGILLRGNHDDRLRRALRGDPINLGAVSHQTLDAVIKTSDRDTFIPRISGMLETSPWWLRIDNYLLVHGALHPAMLVAESPEQVFPRRAANKCRALALYGEGKMGVDEEDLPPRTYRWIARIPANVTVIVGHAVLSTEKIIQRHGALGGRAVFLDTGCGKGGKLSYLDLPKGRGATQK